MRVTICIGSACHLKGSREIIQELQKMVAEHGLSVIYKIIYFAHNHSCLRICKINDYILYIKEIYEIYSTKFPLKIDLGISGAKKFFV